MPVHNEDIAAAFDAVADLLAIQGANPFRVRAYRRASQVVRSLPDELADRVEAGFDPDELPGVGPDLAGKIRELLATGRLGLLEKLRRSTPAGLPELLTLPGLGPTRVRRLHQALGIRSVTDLRHAVAAGRVAATRGLGPALERRLARALAPVSAAARGTGRMPRHEALRRAEALRAYLAGVPGITRVEIAGSLRRGRDTVGDLDLLLSGDASVDLGGALERFDAIRSIEQRGRTRASGTLRGGVRVDLRLVPQQSFGAALYYFTGSKAHNLRVRRMAQAAGLKINEYGVYRGRQRIAGETEASLFAAMGLDPIPPELREDRGEIEAAAAHRLPDLVRREQLRGDLHMHTTASDGHVEPEAYLEAARARGYEYIAITDHSRHLGIVHGLDASGLSRQIDALEVLAERSRGVTLLKGVEVDVLDDGQLALPDRVLKRLDLVIAAVHTQQRLPAKRQTDRLLRALDNRYISILAHPTGRLLGERGPIEADWSRVFRRAALEAGASFSIGSDAHSTDELDFLELGVTQARRAWIPRDRIINCLPETELRRSLRATLR
jgi:DNA polymerase (family 10)